MPANSDQSSTNSPPETDHGKTVRYGFGVERISRFIREETQALLSVSRERKEAIRDEIQVGSVPDMRYYILLAISSLIAALGQDLCQARRIQEPQIDTLSRQGMDAVGRIANQGDPDSNRDEGSWPFQYKPS